MYRKILLAGTTAAVIVGAGGTAMALTGSDTTSGSPSTGSSGTTGQHAGKHKHGKHGELGKLGRLGKRVEHGQFTLKGKDGKSTTIDIINGTVTSVSPTSITVRAADNKSETFAVNSKTKVVERTVAAKKSGSNDKTKGDHKPTKISISQVKSGDHVFVIGTGTGSYTAKRVMDIHGSK